MRECKLIPVIIPVNPFAGSMSTFVSLLEVLESRGFALDEEEVWAILLATAETLTSISYKGKAKDPNT